MKKRIVLALVVALVGFVILVQGSLFVNNMQGDFDFGTYTNTLFNFSGAFVQLNLSGGFLNGGYASQIFNSGTSSTWNNISWTQELCYQCELPGSQQIESGDFVSPANMTGNVLLMHMNEASGAIVDFSGNGNDGRAVNGLTYGASGKFNTALSFDGVNDFARVSDSSSLDITGDIAIEVWTKANNYVGDPDIITKGTFNQAYSVWYVQGTKKVVFSLNNNQLTSNSGLTIGNWHHVVVTREGSTRRIYIDGVEDVSDTFGAAIGTTNTKLKISTSTFSFNGVMDEVAIYNRSLSASEIGEHYKRGALRLNLSVRSCDDVLCVGESWIDVSGSSPQDLTASNNTYFQYKFGFSSDSGSNTPELYNVSIDYGVLNVAPSLNLFVPANGQGFTYNDSISLNYSVSDSNLDSCWYNIDNGVNISLVSCANSTFDVNGGGDYNIYLFANDTQGVESSDSASFSVDVSKPLVEIIYPININYTKVLAELNYVSSDDVALDSCWYSLDEGVTNVSINCGVNVSGLDSGQGSSTWSVYVNDTSGNENSSNVTFFVDSTAPTIGIDFPDAITYGINLSLPLNYSVSDSGIGINSCWYNIDNGVNISLLSCANSTFDVNGDGDYNIYLFANDTFGNENSASVLFSVVTSTPAINLLAPFNGSYLGFVENIYLNYSVFSGISLSSCQLWHDFSGDWKLNDTKSPINNGDYSYVFNLSEGSYIWGVVCNDSSNRVSVKNSSFFVDVTNPSVVLSEPSGVKNSQKTIPLAFSINDSSPTSCIYNVFKGASPDIVNTSLDCNSGGSTFAVSGDGTYILNFYVNDSAGNTNSTNLSFSVDTSVPLPSGGGGGGGGGGGFAVGPKEEITSLSFEELKEIVLKRGTSKFQNLEVTNNGSKFLNGCRLAFLGEKSSWLSNGDVLGLSPGEKGQFGILVSIPEDVEPGIFEAGIKVDCEERSFVKDIEMIAYRNNFEVEILDYVRVGNILRINYSIEEFSGMGHDIVIDFEMLDFSNVPRFRGSSELSLASREVKNEVIEFDLPKDSFGEFVFKMGFDDGVVKIEVEKEIFLPSSGGIGSLVVAKGEKTRLTAVGMGILVLLLGALVFWIFNKFKGKTRKISVRSHKRKLIKFDLNEELIKKKFGFSKNRIKKKREIVSDFNNLDRMIESA